MRLGLSVRDTVHRLERTRAQLGVTIHFPKDDLVDDILFEGLGAETVEVNGELRLELIVFQELRQILFDSLALFTGAASDKRRTPHAERPRTIAPPAASSEF